MVEAAPGEATPLEVKTPVAATEATPAPGSTAEQAAEIPEGEKPEAAPDEPMLKQSEVNKIVARRVAQAERSALKVARAEARAEFAERQLQEREQAVAPQPAGEPQSTDFKDYEDYVVAKAEWRIEQKQAARDKEAKAEREQSQSREDSMGRAQAVREKIEAAAEEFPDLVDLVQGDVPFSEPMAAAFIELDHGAKVAHHLFNHPEEAARIAKLSPVKQVLAFDELGKKLTASPAPTKTPPPIKPSGNNASTDKDWEQLSDKEFAARRKRQIAQR